MSALDLDITTEDLEALDEAEFEGLEAEVARLLAVCQIKNMRGTKAIWHDDQHIGQQRRELDSIRHPSVDLKARAEFRAKAVVDSLDGNSLIHPLDTPVIEVNKQATMARVLWGSIGVEGLSKFREQPMAIISLGFVPGVDILEDGEWRTLWGAWQRTTKNEYHAGWVHSMERTNTRPPLTEEQDRNFLGKYAYRKDAVRQPVPEPPRPDTWDELPEPTDQSWMTLNI